VEEYFPTELIYFAGCVSACQNVEYIRECIIGDTVRNLGIAPRIYLKLPEANTEDRFFSALKRIKNRLRSNIDRDRVSDLSVVLIESSVARNLKYDRILKLPLEITQEKRICKVKACYFCGIFFITSYLTCIF
jgi:hypothetical protein